jgi:hypothetical protein
MCRDQKRKKVLGVLLLFVGITTLFGMITWRLNTL